MFFVFFFYFVYVEIETDDMLCGGMWSPSRWHQTTATDSRNQIWTPSVQNAGLNINISLVVKLGINPCLYVYSYFSPEMMGSCLKACRLLAAASYFKARLGLSMLACMNVLLPITTLKRCWSSMSHLNPALHNLVGAAPRMYFLKNVHEYEIFMLNLPSISVPPTIRVDLRTEDAHRVIECSAADAVPAANVSWLLPEGVSGDSWFNFTSHNGSHSVKGVLLLPACSPWELTALCVINHPAFEEPENRSITLPICGMFNKSGDRLFCLGSSYIWRCKHTIDLILFPESSASLPFSHTARPNITIGSLTEWEDGAEYTKANCSAESVAPAATITWHVANSEKSISYLSETEVRADGSVSVRSSVQLLSSLYSGQNLTCSVEHPSLKAPEKRTIRVPVHSTFFFSKKHFSLWHTHTKLHGLLILFLSPVFFRSPSA